MSLFDSKYECPVCRDSEIEEVYAGHGNVLEIPCWACKTTEYKKLYPDNCPPRLIKDSK